MYLYILPAINTEMALSPLKFAGVKSSLVLLAASWTLKITLVAGLTGSGFTSGFTGVVFTGGTLATGLVTTVSGSGVWTGGSFDTRSEGLTPPSSTAPEP